jgi:hypothetical protein
MPRIKKAQVIRELKEIVAAKGADYVDPGADPDVGTCNYGTPGAPSCIVGHLFDRHNLLGDDGIKVGPMNGSVMNIITPMLADDVSNYDYRQVVVDTFTPKALRALQGAQRIQDEGGTWGQALQAAIDAN